MNAEEVPGVYKGFLIENINNLKPDDYFLFLDLNQIGFGGVNVRKVEVMDGHLARNPNSQDALPEDAAPETGYSSYYLALGRSPSDRIVKAYIMYNDDNS